jgi:hypothetical protein
MSEATLSRVGASAGVLSVILTFAGFALHGGLPDSTTAEAVRSYVERIDRHQAGIGNYVELLGYLLFLVFAAFLYAVARVQTSGRLNWLPIVALVSASAYVAVSAAAIAAQQMIVEWGKVGADPKNVLGVYILDENAFTLSFELAALFLAAVGLSVLPRQGMLRLTGMTALAVAAILFLCGLIGTAYIDSGISQAGFLLLVLWTLLAAAYFLIRPPLPTESA